MTLAETPKSWSMKEKKNKLNFVLKDTVGNIKDESWIGRKYLKITCLIKDMYRNYVKNSQNTIIRK